MNEIKSVGWKTLCAKRSYQYGGIYESDIFLAFSFHISRCISSHFIAFIHLNCISRKKALRTLRRISRSVSGTLPKPYTYRIRPNYRTYPYKRTVKRFRSVQIIVSVRFVYFFINAYVVGTHLNCIDKSMQFK